MRIISGKYRGKKLTALPLKSDSIRPTSDRVKESIFNILAHNDILASFENIRVLDLFSGTGAMGLEALSRGASHVTFIDKAHEAMSICKANIKLLGAEDVTKALNFDVAKPLPKCEEPFDLVFIDPPYGVELEQKALENLIAQDWLKNGTLLIVETDKITDVPLPASSLTLLFERIYGKTKISFIRFAL